MRTKSTFIALFISVLLIAGCEKSNNNTTDKNQTVPQQNQQTTQQQQPVQQQPPVQQPPVQQQQTQQTQTPQQNQQQKPPATVKHVALFKCPQMNNEEIDSKITEKVKKVRGVLDVKTNHINTFLIKVLYEPEKTSAMLIRDAIKEAGYEAELSEDKEMK